MGIIKAIKDLLPNKLSASQRTKVVLGKQSMGKTKYAFKEAGRTARSIVSNIAANRTIQQKLASDATKKYTNDKMDEMEKALAVFNSIVKGNPDQDGGKGSNSTTTIGGSGSALGG